MSRIVDATVPFCIGDQDLELYVRARFTKGCPAYIPKGEYAAIDPAEPDEYDIEAVTVKQNDTKDPFRDTYINVQDWLFKAVVDDYDAGGLVREKLDESAGEWE